MPLSLPPYSPRFNSFEWLRLKTNGFPDLIAHPGEYLLRRPCNALDHFIDPIQNRPRPLILELTHRVSHLAANSSMLG
jgi:hypothetical protein